MNFTFWMKLSWMSYFGFASAMSTRLIIRNPVIVAMCQRCDTSEISSAKTSRRVQAASERKATPASQIAKSSSESP